MRNVIIMLAMAFIVSCQPSASSTSQKNGPSTPSPKPAEIQQTSKTFSLPEVQSFTQTDIWRESDVKDKHGFDLPPYKKVNLNIFEFDRKPVVGDKVTVVPLEVNAAPIELKILKATESEGCAKSSPRKWRIELEPITGREFFEVSALPNRREDAPFDVCIIYPAVEFVRQIRLEQLTKEVVPEGITIRTVTAAIDLTNDLKPDILIAQYCCQDSTKPREECDLTCGKTFKKVKDKWKLVEESQPC